MASPESVLQKLLKQGEKSNTRSLNKLLKDLQTVYRESLESIQSEIDKLYRKYGDKVTFETMNTYNRLRGYEKAIQEELKVLEKQTRIIMKTGFINHYEQSYISTAFALEKSTQMKFGYIPLSRKRLLASLQNPLNKIQWNESNQARIVQLNNDISRALTQGLIEGKGHKYTARLITKRMNIGFNRAKLITRTETHRLQNSARSDSIAHAMRKAEQNEIFLEKVWISTLDGRTRDTHVKMDGAVADSDGNFTYVTQSG